jgi:hypothetical protein
MNWLIRVLKTAKNSNPSAFLLRLLSAEAASVGSGRAGLSSVDVVWPIVLSVSLSLLFLPEAQMTDRQSLIY